MGFFSYLLWVQTTEVIGGALNGPTIGVEKKPDVILCDWADITEADRRVVSLQHLRRKNINEVNVCGVIDGVTANNDEPFQPVGELTAASSSLRTNVAICMVAVLCRLTPMHTLPSTVFWFSHSVTWKTMTDAVWITNMNKATCLSSALTTC